MSSFIAWFALAVPRPRGRLAATAIALEILLGIGAVGGGLALMAGPNGEILPLPVSALAGSPFANYFVPGVVLFTLIGLGPLGAALLAWRRHPVAPFLAFAAGAALIIWLVVEIAIVGYASNPPLLPLYLALGVAMLLVGGAWVRQARSQRSTRVSKAGAPEAIATHSSRNSHATSDSSSSGT